jgi:hypothetical protein
VRASISCALTRTRLLARCTLPMSTCAILSACAISGKLRDAVVRYCITLVRLMTFRSAIFARFVRISSCTPSAKKEFSWFALRFSNGSTAIDFSSVTTGAVTGASFSDFDRR